MSKTFCVTITESKNNGDKATVGFVVANAALATRAKTSHPNAAKGRFVLLWRAFGRVCGVWSGLVWCMEPPFGPRRRGA